MRTEKLVVVNSPRPVKRNLSRGRYAAPIWPPHRFNKLAHKKTYEDKYGQSHQKDKSPFSRGLPCPFFISAPILRSAKPANPRAAASPPSLWPRLFDGCIEAGIFPRQHYHFISFLNVYRLDHTSYLKRAATVKKV